MVIVCPECGASHSIAESGLPPAATMARCKGCNARFPLPLGRNAPDDQPRPASSCEPGAPAARAGSDNARILGVLISKGGVGKTTTAVNLSAGLALSGSRVLLVDTDTQGQAAYLLGVKPKLGLAEVLAEEADAREAVYCARDHLDLLAGGKSLAGVKRLIDRKEFGGEHTLREALAPLTADYDYVVVDSAPGWDPLTVNVLFFVREVLVPVSLEIMSLQGLTQFLASLNAVARYNSDIELKYILPTFLDKRIKGPGRLLERLRQAYPELVCEPVRYNVRLSQAPARGRTIFEFDNASAGANDYRELVRAVTGDETIFQRMRGAA